jgi:4-amino-4-deoxy-L-arabinose transferase-like glycosyltransferase
VRSKNNNSSINFYSLLNLKTFCIGGGILLLGLFLRVYNLLILPMFADEAIYIRWAQIMKNDATLRFLPLTDGKQPLFMWVVIPFLKFFNDPLIAGRMVSVLSGMGSIVGIFLLTYEVFKDKRIGLLAAFFYAISPYNVFFNRMALVDSMLTMFGIWALYFAVLTARTLRLDFALLTGFCLGGALLTKSPGAFFILLLPTTFFLTSNNLKFKTKIWKMICFWIVSTAVAYVMYSILKLGPSYEMLSSRSKEYIYGFKDILSNPLLSISINSEQFFEWLLYLAPILFVILAIGSILVTKNKYRKEILIVSAWFIIPTLIELEIAKVFTARYLLFAIFPIFILSAVAVLNLLIIPKRVLVSLVTAFCLISLYLDYLIIASPEQALLPKNERAGYLEAWTAGTGIRETGQFIKEIHEKNPDEHIVVGAEGGFGALPNGLQMYIEDLPNVTVRGHDVPDLHDMDSGLINAKRSGDTVFLVINASRFHMSYEDAGVVEVAQYTKAEREDGTRDKLLVLELTEMSVNLYNRIDAIKRPKKL